MGLFSYVKCYVKFHLPTSFPTSFPGHPSLAPSAGTPTHPTHPSAVTHPALHRPASGQPGPSQILYNYRLPGDSGHILFPRGRQSQGLNFRPHRYVSTVLTRSDNRATTTTRTIQGEEQHSKYQEARKV